jgi:hypothetical protein
MKAQILKQPQFQRYPSKNVGTNGGANEFLKAINPVFMSFSEDHSIDPSPPFATTKAARDNHLAAFFIGKPAV